MLTNVFRLGFRQISWFQLISVDGDSISPSERWSNDRLTNKVLNTHIKLQNEGHLCAWTPSDYFGPHGGSLVKLWLFIPGRNENINMAIQSSLIGLKVISYGLWIFSKDSNEVTNALCQAVQNRMERGLKSVGYMRFGDVFVKCRAFATNEPQSRRPLPACEVTFTASEEAIFVHFVLHRKRVRSLSADDIQAALELQHNSSVEEKESQAVVVAPHGMRGKLIGCYSSDLIQMLHESRAKADNEHLDFSPQSSSSYYHGISSAPDFHAEISFDLEASAKPPRSKGIHAGQDSKKLSSEKEDKICTKPSYQAQRILLYSPEAVIIPLVPAVPAKIFLRRCWLQKCVGTSWIEHELQAGSKVANSHGSWCKSIHCKVNVGRMHPRTAVLQAAAMGDNAETRSWLWCV